jgi:hypothetical protein
MDVPDTEARAVAADLAGKLREDVFLYTAQGSILVTPGGECGPLLKAIDGELPRPPAPRSAHEWQKEKRQKQSGALARKRSAPSALPSCQDQVAMRVEPQGDRTMLSLESSEAGRLAIMLTPSDAIDLVKVLQQAITRCARSQTVAMTALNFGRACFRELFVFNLVEAGSA